MADVQGPDLATILDRKSTRLNSSHLVISYAVFCLKKKTRAGRADGIRLEGVHQDPRLTRLVRQAVVPSRSVPRRHCFFFNDRAPPGISSLSLHDALPI